MAQPSQNKSFSRLAVVSRSQQVREQLEQAILRGDYAVDERLPSERELARVFGVSRVSIREALSTLEAVGLVQIRPGAGTTIVDPATRPDRDVSGWMDANRAELVELLRVRSALDILAGEEAARRHETVATAAVRQAHEAFAAAAEAGAPKQLAGLDMEFHLAIAMASGSELLHDLLADLHHHLVESREVFFAPANRARASADEHALILTAIERADGPGARAATEAHIASVLQMMEA